MATGRGDFGGFPTAAVSDALDRLGIAGQVKGMRGIAPGLRCAGPAFTVRYAPIGTEGGTVGDYVDDVPAGSVVVLDAGGRLDLTVWGDLLTEVALGRSLAGTVIHGVCRDRASLRESGYPVFSRGAHMRTGKGRVRVEAIQGRISLGEVVVAPDDVVIADDDGVVVVPAGRSREVLEWAGEIDAAEASIRERVRAGAPLARARVEMGYHDLQTPRGPA